MVLLELAFTLFLVALNGFFVAAEFAIVKVRASQIELRAKDGSRSARLAQRILEHLDSYLSATQFGITLASLGLGWVGEPIVAGLIVESLAAFNIALPPGVEKQVGFVVAFSTITFLHIVFGELAPKSLAIQFPEKVTMALAWLLHAFYLLFKPFIWALNSFANFILKSAGIVPAHDHGVHSVEELRLLLAQGKETGTIQQSDHELIENVFDFADRTVRQIMMARTDIVAIDVETPYEQLLSIIIEQGYSRYPVYRDTIDQIVGVVYSKDVLAMISHKNLIILQDMVRPAYFVPETKRVSTLLRELQRQKMHMAIVLDEFGGTAGLITLENIIEEIIGDIQDEYDDEVPMATRLDGDSFVVNARMRVDELNRFLDKSLPEDKDYDTVAGLVNFVFERIPREGDTTEFQGYQITILKTSKRAIETVSLRLLPEAGEDA